MNRFDVVVIGGGPAGLTAGFWCAELGLKAAVLEAGDQLGGQLHVIKNPILNYPGCTAESGKRFFDKFVISLNSRAFERIVNSAVSSVSIAENAVTTHAGIKFIYRGLVIASGVRRRRLGIEGELAFVGRGILESGSGEATKTKGKTVAIIGGGDAALENALILSAYARKIYVIHRRGQFRARREFREPVINQPNIEILAPATPVAIRGKDFVEGVVVYEQSGKQRFIATDFV